MMGRVDSGQDKLFYSFNLDNHVPQSHLLRGIDRFLDLRDLRQHLAPFYSPMGRLLTAPSAVLQPDGPAVDSTWPTQGVLCVRMISAADSFE